MINRALVAILACMGLSAPAAAGQTAFDLNCTGQRLDHSGVSPFADRISIDLASMRWCDRQVGCPFVVRIPVRHGDKLTLLSAKTAYNEADFQVDLSTTAFTKVTRIPDRAGSEISARGVCTLAPYTPLP